MRRIQRRHLPGSRWTACVPLPASVGERHFEVLEFVAGSGQSEVVMRAILTGRRYQVALATLADEAAWDQGWTSLHNDEPVPPGPDTA